MRIIKNDGFVRENHSEEWIEWKDILKEYSDSKSGSNPPGSGNNPITDPTLYENGYLSITQNNVTGYNRTYKTYFSFTGTSICSPVAATNMMLYWYMRDSNVYASLRRNNDSTWSSTFSRFYQLMETQSNGTNRLKIAPAYRKYLREAGYTPVVLFETHPTKNTVKSEIDENRPFHLSIINHYYYQGDHSVLGLGYKRYNYSGGYNSMYIRIADGWISTPSRFIHIYTGNDGLFMTRMKFQ